MGGGGQDCMQTDVMCYSECGKCKYVHVSVDTHSRFLVATADTGERAHGVCRHWLKHILLF